MAELLITVETEAQRKKILNWLEKGEEEEVLDFAFNCESKD